jgi:hypothetical protein
MARAISLIQQQILDNVAADPTLGPLLTSTSKRAIYNLWAFIVAVAVNVVEQLIDIMNAFVESVAAAAAPGSPAWVQAQVLNFQYSDTVPQVAQLINFAPAYPVVDPTLRIISRCSISTDLANNVQIKVATGTTPAALSTDQLAALVAYVKVFGVAGITYTSNSTDADRLYIQAEVYYLGQYGTAEVLAVQTAIANFLATIPFNGVLKVSDLEAAIRTVPGVDDVLLQNVSARAATTAYGSGTSLVLNNQVVSRIWNTVSGYIINEDTTGETIDLSLTFIPV